MRLAVFGTSNCLPTSAFAQALAANPRVKSVSNHSIGASTSVLSALTAGSLDFSRFDFYQSSDPG